MRAFHFPEDCRAKLEPYTHRKRHLLAIAIPSRSNAQPSSTNECEIAITPAAFRYRTATTADLRGGYSKCHCLPDSPQTEDQAWHANLANQHMNEVSRKTLLVFSQPLIAQNTHEKNIPA